MPVSLKMKEVFYSALDRLVADARRYRTTGFGTVDPEEATKFNLIEPLLVSLGYSRDDIKKEFHILGDQADLGILAARCVFPFIGDGV